MSELAYLACPYTHPNPEVVEARKQAALECTGRLIDAGYLMYNPLLNSCAVAGLGYAPANGWYEYDLQVLERCERLMVLQLPGWWLSVGVQRELSYALTRGGLIIEYLPAAAWVDARVLNACHYPA